MILFELILAKGISTILGNLAMSSQIKERYWTYLEIKQY